MQAATLTELISIVTNLALAAIPIFVSLALLFFFWGMALFILNSSSEKGQKAGREKMVWGLIALFVILSIGGLVSIIEKTFIEPSSRSGGIGSGLYVGGTPRSGGSVAPLEGSVGGSSGGGSEGWVGRTTSWCVGRGWLDWGSNCN